MDNTSIGQSARPPKAGEDRSTRATTEGVDAQNANEFDARHGLAGAEAKPFRSEATEHVEHEGASPSPADDATPQHGLVTERRNPGADDPTEMAGRSGKSGRDDTLDEDLDREQLQPGLNAEGTGGAGGAVDGHHEDSNSNT